MCFRRPLRRTSGPLQLRQRPQDSHVHEVVGHRASSFCKQCNKQWTPSVWSLDHGRTVAFCARNDTAVACTSGHVQQARLAHVGLAGHHLSDRSGSLSDKALHHRPHLLLEAADPCKDIIISMTTDMTAQLLGLTYAWYLQFLLSRP